MRDLRKSADARFRPGLGYGFFILLAKVWMSGGVADALAGKTTGRPPDRYDPHFDRAW